MFDLDRLNRRQLLSLAAGAGAAALFGACSSADQASTGTAGTSASSEVATSGAATSGAATTTTAAAAGTTVASGAATTCDPIPEETAGPFPGDGSNGPNVLAEADVVRQDIRSSIGSATGVADGVPLAIDLTLVDSSAGCAPLAGAAVYAWHCDREGRYSMYSQGAEEENYLRGVQESDASGRLSFMSIFPACYQGRWPHIHFEVYASVADATSGGAPIATSQLALPEDACAAVYGTEGYSDSVANLSSLSLETDNVFSDGAEDQVATVTGDPTSGYVSTLTVTV